MSTSSLRPHWPRWMTPLLVVITAAATIGAATRLVRDPLAAYRPAPLRSGTEVLMVLIGSSGCAGTAAPGLPEAVARVKTALRSKAEREAQSFVTIGVALDWSIPKGMAMLERFGPFDEVMVGRSWLNSGVVKYIWKDVPGFAATPQIVVLEREIANDGGFVVGPEQVRTRRIGADAIIAWSRTLPAASAPGVGEAAAAS